MKYLLYILNILILPALWSCTNDDVPFKQEQQEGEVLLTLTLKSATLTTRTEAGVTDLNENAIHKVDLFLYPTGKTNENAVVQITDINNFTSQDDGEVTFTVPITSEQKDYLFPAGSNNICVGYAIANRPGNFSAPKKTVDNKAVDDTSMEALKNIVISSTTFEASEYNGTDDQKTIAEKDGRQADFVMDGYTDGTTYKIMLTSNDSQEIVTGTIPLDRAASKITLGLTVTDNVTEDGVTWTPGDAEVLFYHGVKKAKVDVTYNANTAYTPVAEDYFDLTGKNARQLTKNYLNYTQEVPFYSYSSDWGNGDKEAYLVLVLYWTPQVDGGNPTPFYYRVPINPESNNLVRNTYYKINLEVGILGSRELSTETVPLSPSCILLDWGDNNITADLKQPRYLVVDKHEVFIYGENTVSIPYSSSHDVTIIINKIEYLNYAKVTTRTIRLSKNAESENLEKKESTDNTNWTDYSAGNNESDNNIYTDYLIKDDDEEGTYKNTNVEIKKTVKNIDFKHIMSSNSFTPHKVYITVKHSDNSAYSEQIVINQYPSIYIEGKKSNGYVFVNEKTDNDGNINTDNGSHYLGSIIDREDIGAGGTSQNSNTNPNQYTMHVTEGHAVGDPRVELGTEWEYASQFNTDKGLKYYRPTRTDASNIMAPVFKIASSYARTQSISFANAQKRCASYQENGYPAGRWRIPTAAEMEFITSLWGQGAIPSIFNSAYWVADGRQYDYANGNGFTNNTNATTVRCVYDVWYWGDTQQENAMTSPQWAVETINN